MKANKSIKLYYPVEFGGGKIESLTMRRSTLDDHIHNQELEGMGDEERSHFLLANLCEQSPDFFAEMDCADLKKLHKQYQKDLDPINKGDKKGDIKFDFPLSFGEGEKKTTIPSTTIRRAKGKDTIKNEKIDCSDAKREAYLMAELTGMSFKNIVQLAMSDYLKIKGRFLGFLSSQPMIFSA
jgi:hypothetical protein